MRLPIIFISRLLLLINDIWFWKHIYELLFDKIWFLESVLDCNKFAVSLSWCILQTYAGYYHGVRSLQKKLPQLIYLHFVLHLS
jgi:hypothetical protein